MSDIPTRVHDLTGRRFCKLVVLEYVEKYRWKCLCDCGKTIITRSKTLKNRNTKSCGCIQIKNLTGKTFGFLKVLKIINVIKNSGAIWKCKCVCGKYVSVARGNLISGNSKSCGCKTREIIRKTCIKTYGKEHHTQHQSVKNKKIITNLKRYGVEHPSQNNEIKNKQKITCIKRYGVDNPIKNASIALKAAKSQNNSYTLMHWKTGKDIICIASYEKKVVEYLNINKINFKWQHRTFVMPNGRTFRPDCYLIGKRKPWIEIKGYFRDDAKEKWEWFHKEHPNSEIWNREKLLEMKIL